jgi:cytochrome c oxidase cbb3-type subunit 2
MEKFATITLAAGLGCFGIAGIVSGYLPIAHLSKIEYKTLDQIAPDPSQEFILLAERYPDTFKKYYGEPTTEAFHTALRLGRDQYIAEGCWHCHSQFIRPVSNEDVRFGPVSWAGEYMNEMFLPHLFGTRRVGPDLIREHGKHSNDWHVAHFYEPTEVVPTSVMPNYRWFFDGEQPNKTGIAVITYVQWLGSWATPRAMARRARERQATDAAQ